MRQVHSFELHVNPYELVISKTVCHEDIEVPMTI